MSGRSPHSRERLSSQIREDISLFLLKDFSDPRLKLLSITHVELTEDLSHAKIYWDTFSSEKKEQIEEALTSIKGKMRSKLARVLTNRQVPTLTFIYNSQYESEAHIKKLLKS